MSYSALAPHMAFEVAVCANCEQVPLLNFSRWLQQHVAPEDFVVIKMDIEGSEYEVLEPALLH